MSENNKQQVQEIDLLELFQRIGQAIGNFFIALLRGLLFLIYFGIRKAHFLVLFVVGGALIGLMLFKSTSRYYSSYMVAQANGVNSTDMVNYINDLHELCRKNNTEALAFDLQMADSTAAKIKDIQAYYIIDANKDKIGDYVDFKNEYNPKDTTQVRLEDRIHVAVEVLDNKAFTNVKNGLLRYMRKNPYMIKLNKIRQDELKELIAQTEHEIQKLDSLQNTDYFKSKSQLASNPSQMMILAEKEPTMYYKDKMTLISRKLSYQKELEIASDVFTVVKDFTSLAVAENPRGQYLVKYGFYFGVLGYLLLLFLKYRNNISEFVQPSTKD